MRNMTNLYIPVCGFLCAVLLIVCFFSKKRIKSKDTQLFSGMLITSFLDSIFMIAIIFIAYVSKESVLLLEILNKLDYLQFLLWIWFFFLYIVHISYKDNDKLNHIFKVTGVINILIILAMFILPVKLYNMNNIMYSYGDSCNVLYISAAIYILFILITLMINLDKILNKKYLPFYIFVILATVVLIMKNVNPGVVIITASLAYVNLIMYFTIENPDLKMIEELELAKNQADKANYAKTDFLSSMSHEIRTPLNAIVGFSECIKQSDDIDEVHQDAEDVIKASKTLLEIVNGILDISKIESGKLEIMNSDYQSKEIFHDVAKLITPKMEEKALDFQVSIADDIPDVLYGDYGNVKKVITNILSNAVKYTEKGYVKYEVRCINNKNVCRLVISVEDSGRGIKKENIDKLFTKFQRLDEDKNTTLEGTGLGLAITKQIVELMGGKVIVQSVYGSGSKFTIILDQRIEAVKQVEQEIKNNKKINTKVDVSGKSVLIVDDNVLNIKVASKLLSKYQLNIDTCESGLDAIKKIKDGNNYDLILLDDMMPKLSGVETFKRLRAIYKVTIPIIALTANAITGMKEKYLNIGFNDYLAKPINKDELYSIIQKYLGGSSKNIESTNFGELPNEIYEVGVGEGLIVPKANNGITFDYLRKYKIDVDKGLELLGDKDLYNETMKEFLDHIEERKRKLELYKEQKNMKDYSIEVHALKSDSKYLGFTYLAELAYDQELKSKDNDYSYIDNNFNNLKKELNKIIDIITDYLHKKTI